ncbi:sulfotransferase family 2 domain-containing protein [Azospirillum himalayense]|uniref:Sulfotransferase family 2 domain-containing protein n=1 Tax=Azospirillum himalayense TaxID=654847 RepID=A0ABW0G618_9PROT
MKSALKAFSKSCAPDINPAPRINDSDTVECAHPQPASIPRNDRLCFLHIPKAGGTSIGGFFGKFFHVNEISTLLSPLDLQRMPMSELRNTRLLRSHAVQTAYQMCGQDFRTISFVRQPVERAISHFKHLRTLADSLPDYRIFAGMDLSTFLASEAGRAEIMNLQCSLYGIGGTVATPLLVNPHGWQRPSLMDRLGSPEMLEDALAFANTLDYVGTIENWLHNISALCMDMNWPVPEQADLHRLNEGQLKLTEVRKQDLAEIERLVSLDLELYAAIEARETMEAQKIQEQLEDARERYESTGNRRESHYYWNFENSFFANGVYQRESGVVKNAFGREDIGANLNGRRLYSYWGGEDIAFDAWLNPGNDYRMRACFDFLEGFEFSKVELSINGTIIDRDSWQTTFGREMMVDAAIPARLLKESGFVRVRFTCPGQGRRVPGDSRLLALHMQWIELFPDR